jgi:protein dpy-30
MSVRNYLDQTIMASLYEGLRQLIRERPENPFEFLAFYLLKQDPTHKHHVTDFFQPTSS